MTGSKDLPSSNRLNLLVKWFVEELTVIFDSLSGSVPQPFGISSSLCVEAELGQIVNRGGKDHIHS